MNYLFILPSYLAWHYSGAFRDIARVWVNFLWFLYSFFSLPLLVRTLFAPWRRLSEERPREGFDLEKISEIIVGNVAMRVVGAVIRLFTICVGGIMVLVVFWGGLLFYALWLILPVLIPASFVYGLSSLLGAL